MPRGSTWLSPSPPIRATPLFGFPPPNARDRAVKQIGYESNLTVEAIGKNRVPSESARSRYLWKTYFGGLTECHCGTRGPASRLWPRCPNINRPVTGQSTAHETSSLYARMPVSALLKRCSRHCFRLSLQGRLFVYSPQPSLSGARAVRQCVPPFKTITCPKPWPRAHGAGVRQHPPIGVNRDLAQSATIYISPASPQPGGNGDRLHHT